MHLLIFCRLKSALPAGAAGRPAIGRLRVTPSVLLLVRNTLFWDLAIRCSVTIHIVSVGEALWKGSVNIGFIRCLWEMGEHG